MFGNGSDVLLGTFYQVILIGGLSLLLLFNVGGTLGLVHIFCFRRCWASVSILLLLQELLLSF